MTTSFLSRRARRSTNRPTRDDFRALEPPHRVRQNRCQREVVEHDLREAGLDGFPHVVEGDHRDAHAGQHAVHCHVSVVSFEHTLDGDT